MNTDEYGFKRKFVSPSARKGTQQAGSYVCLDIVPPQAVCTNLRLSVQICVPKIFKKNRKTLKL